jgi:orotate phosphoribosyltransferase
MKTKIAKMLLSLGCLKISPKEPFLYASGLKGPIYCDNRKILSHVQERREVIGCFLQRIKESGIECDRVAGLATGGIPYAAWIAEELGLPMLYVRGKAKEHGKKSQIEGEYKSGDRIILIEDLVNQGSSLKNAVMALDAHGVKPVACFSIVNYNMIVVDDLIKDLGLSLFSLTDFFSIIRVASLDREDRLILEKWHGDPKHWSL